MNMKAPCPVQKNSSCSCWSGPEKWIACGSAHRLWKCRIMKALPPRKPKRCSVTRPRGDSEDLSKSPAFLAPLPMLRKMSVGPKSWGVKQPKLHMCHSHLEIVAVQKAKWKQKFHLHRSKWKLLRKSTLTFC
jgi:hypothetical protein